jgi:protein transport protein SEC31
VQWCPRNPDLFAAGFFDGTIGIHSIQATNEENTIVPPTPQPDGSDIFDAPGFSRAGRATLTLKQPPKWLRRPTSSSFGYGGKLTTVSNLPSAQGKNQSSVIHLRNVISEDSVVDRAKKLQAAVDGEKLQDFSENKAVDTEGKTAICANWKALLSLFQADSRDELVTLLGFSKTETAARVAEAIANLRSATESITANRSSPSEEDVADIKLHEPVVSFAEPERDSSEEGDGDDTLDVTGSAVENTPSEVSGSATSDTTSAMRLADGESITTAPSLFGDDNVGGLQTDAGADFFTTMGLTDNTDGQQIQVPHYNYGLDSSVAATIGSGPSSVTSETLKNHTFHIYPSDESQTDHLVTKALVLGDFDSAVSLCLSAGRFADAILLAVKGGPELLQRTQRIYFERRTISLPYLRLFQSIVTNDLSDIVQNADLQDWQEIFVVLCTFASQDDFSSLTEQLGRRLEFQSHLAKGSETLDAASRALTFRKNATLTYLASGRLERLVNIWIEELAEDESSALEDEERNWSRYAVHAHALQTFIEKVTVFRGAVKYIDADISKNSTEEESSARTYKLSALYDRYFEYADLLASQGLVKEAVTFLNLTPLDYVSSPGSAIDLKLGRERILTAAGLARQSTIPSTTPLAATKNIVPAVSSYPYSQYSQPTAPVVPMHAQATHAYEPYSIPNSSTYTPVGAMKPTATQHQPLAPQSFPASNPYRPPSTTQPGMMSTPQQVNAMLPPPPRQANGSSAVSQAPPPSSKRKDSGWNDAPVVNEKRPPSRLNQNKPPAITAPFPNATYPNTPGASPPVSQVQHPSIPPPPHPGSVNSRPPPPPHVRNQSPLQHQGPPPFPYAAPGPSGQPHGMHPPRMMSPSQGSGVRPPPSQAGPPPGRGHIPPGSTPPPGGPHPAGPGIPSQATYPHATPPPGPYAPASSQQPGGAHPPPMGNRMGPPPRVTPGPSAPMQPPPQGPPRAESTAVPSAQSRVQQGPPTPRYRT